MNEYTIFTTEQLYLKNSSMTKRVREQLDKDIFFATYAYNIQLKNMKFCKGRLIFQVIGQIQQVNEFIKFILLRMSQKAEQVLFRSYCLLNSHLV